MEDLTVFLRRMPKVELHVHLESTMPGEMLARFASRQGRELPRPAEQLYDCSAEDLSDFLSFLDGICSFVGTPEELTEAAEHAALAAGEENILYSELILNPTHWPQFTAAEIIAAVTAGFDRAAERGGTDCRFTLSLSRTPAGVETMPAWDRKLYPIFPTSSSSASSRKGAPWRGDRSPRSSRSRAEGPFSSATWSRMAWGTRRTTSSW